jgi:hypothetical protein
MKDKIKIRGNVTIQVFDKNGKLKRRSPGFFRRLFGLKGKLLVQEYHNIVTHEGDALIADALLVNPRKIKVSSSNGYIQVGTGWTGNSTKTTYRCNTPTGAMKALDDNYPVLLGEWGEAGDTIVMYRATFPAGSLEANGINEACLLNGNGNGAISLAYAQISPAVNVTASDTLQILWDISIMGQ